MRATIQLYMRASNEILTPNRGTSEQRTKFLLTFFCQSTSSVFISPSFSVCHCLLNLKVKCLLFSLKPLLFLLLSVYTGGANQFGFGQSARGPSGFMHTNPPIHLNTHLPLYAHLYLPLIPFALLTLHLCDCFIDNGSRKRCFSEMNKWLSRHSTCWCYKINKAQWHNL